MESGRSFAMFQLVFFFAPTLESGCESSGVFDLRIGAFMMEAPTRSNSGGTTNE